MRNYPVIVLIALPLAALLSIVGISLFIEREPPKLVHKPRGYLQMVDLYIQRDWLRLEEMPCLPGETCRTRTVITEAYENQKLGDDEKKALREYVRKSYLIDDIREFNERGNHSRFEIRNGRLRGVDQFAHNVILPNIGRRNWRWTGTLTYRPPSAIAGRLQTKDLNVVVSPPREPLATLDRFELVELGRSAGQPQTSGQKVRLTLGKMNIATLRLVGDFIVLESEVQSARGSIHVNGQRVARGTHWRLEEGDVVRVSWIRTRPTGEKFDRSRLFWVNLTRVARILSTHQNVNGRFQRHPAEPEIPLARDVVAVLDSTVLSLLDRPYAAGMSLRNGPDAWPNRIALTLDPDLQLGTQELLNRKVEELRLRYGPSRGRKDEAKRAAVTILDARTGELLALASYPQREADDDGAELNSSLLRNQNFIARPMGSVVKAFYAAAILNERPELIGLRLSGQSLRTPIETLLGIPVDLDKEQASVQTLKCVDLNSFIQHSSNGYAFALMLLAAERAPPERRPVATVQRDCRVGQRQYVVGRQVYELDPSRLAFARAGDPTQAGEFETLPVAGQMRDLFSVMVHSTNGEIGYGSPSSSRPFWTGDDRIDTAIWRDLLVRIYPDQEGPPSTSEVAFRSVSPERTNLKFNLIRNVRDDYLSQVLGGAESRWSLVKTAESFARLVSGCRLHARLYWHQRIGPECGAQRGTKGRIGLDSTVRKALMNALTLPAAAGTARRMKSSLVALDRELEQHGLALGVFAKTGTPQIVSRKSTRLKRALDALIEDKALHYDRASGKIHYRNAGVVRRYRNVADRTLDNSTIDALSGNKGDRQRIQQAAGPGRAVSVREIVWRVALFNRSRNRAQRQALFDVSDEGELLAARDDLEEVENGGAVVVYLGAFDRSAVGKPLNGGSFSTVDVEAEPRAALVIAVRLENALDGSRDAVELVGRLIRTSLKSHLLNAARARKN